MSKLAVSNPNPVKPYADRHEDEFYETPIPYCRAVLKRLAHHAPKTILDPCAGSGNWGIAARQLWPKAHIVGVEVNPTRNIPNGVYDELYIANFMLTTSISGIQFDLVVSNPPYGDPWDQEMGRAAKAYNKARKDGDPKWVKPERPQDRPPANAEAFVRHAWQYVAPNGVLSYLLQLNFLAGQKRAVGLWQELPTSNVIICSKRISFSGNRKTDAVEYAQYEWRKDPLGLPIRVSGYERFGLDEY